MTSEIPSGAFETRREVDRKDRRFASQVSAPKFSEEQQQVADLVDEGLSVRQIAKKLSVELATIDRLIGEVLLERYRYEKNPRAPLESKEKGADVIAALTDPQRGTFKEIARSEGMSQRAVERLNDKVDSTLVATKLKLEHVRTKDLLRLVSHNVKRVLEAFSDEDIARASLKDKAITTGILLEKRQLLAGEPTQILSIHDRGKLDELVAVIIKESVRRGVTIDVTNGTAQVINADNDPYTTHQRPDPKELARLSKERIEAATDE